jgi:hypothetical protein
VKERIFFCQEVKPRVSEILRKLIVNENNVIAEKDFLFAGVKEYERSVTKLKEYFEEVRSDKYQDVVPSAAYKLKDLLRCSVICDTVEQAETVVSLLTKSNFAVFEFKNGYQDKKDKDGNIIQFDPAQ